jgi:tRNA threonylcarbamoyladenosine biosynthesis protein TsaE
MKLLIIERFGLEELEEVAAKVLDVGRNETIWLLNGAMGAGKTTFVKALGKVMGVMNNVQSPTFSIVNEYITMEGETIYHFDCYRLKNTAEAYDIGLEEYLDSGYICLIEWPERIEELLPNSYVEIHISGLPDGGRKLEVLKKT